MHFYMIVQMPVLQEAHVALVKLRAAHKQLQRELKQAQQAGATTSLQSPRGAVHKNFETRGASSAASDASEPGRVGLSSSRPSSAHAPGTEDVQRVKRIQELEANALEQEKVIKALQTQLSDVEWANPLFRVASAIPSPPASSIAEEAPVMVGQSELRQRQPQPWSPRLADAASSAGLSFKVNVAHI